MINMLEDIGTGGKVIRLITNLFWSQKATVKIREEKTEKVETKRRVNQVCVLSPHSLFLYGQQCLGSLEDSAGLSIGGKNITNSRYADDTVLLANSEEKLQGLVSELQET